MFGRFKQVNVEGLERVLRGDKGEFKFNERFPVDVPLKKLNPIHSKLTIKDAN